MPWTEAPNEVVPSRVAEPRYFYAGLETNRSLAQLPTTFSRTLSYTIFVDKEDRARDMASVHLVQMCVGLLDEQYQLPPTGKSNDDINYLRISYAYLCSRDFSKIPAN